MEQYFSVLLRCPLFSGMEQEELKAMLECLEGKFVAVSKGEPVFLEGAPAQLMGVVLSGGVQVVQDDYYGNRSVLSILQPGESFGEAFFCAGLERMPASVFAVRDSELLVLNCRRVLTLCARSCRFHNLLLQNILKGLAQKNLAFTQKVRYMSQNTTKEKLMAYLLDQAKQHKSAEFVIPCDRQALADYLGGRAFGHVGGNRQAEKSRAAGYKGVLVLHEASRRERKRWEHPLRRSHLTLIIVYSMF